MSVKTFIDRPIFSVMISVTIVILGIIGLVSLPLEQYPDIAPPTVKVTASYTGANAETVMKSVVTPLEASINGVENMQYMTSTASNDGTCTISIYFKQGSDADMAAVNVQNRVSSAQGQLPAEVVKSGITVKKTQNSNLKFITLYSPDGRYDAKFLTNYLKINIEPQLARIPGVGEVNVFGADYSLRIWLDPNKMKAYGLVPSDIDNVLAAQNLESPTGSLGAESNNTFQYVLKYRGRYSEIKDFENMVVKTDSIDGIVRLSDIAKIELGTVDYNLRSTTEGKPGASASITQVAGSNANDIIKQMDQVEAQARRTLPPGMVLEDQTSVMDFLNASIQNVVETLIIALVLVIIVVFLFLRSWRSMVVPIIAILVSLIGTFGFIYVMGFSLNLLTLFALVLVIGTVVDDSIVVVEAVQAQLDAGEKSVYKATVKAMKGLSSALFSTTLVFMAVFIPVSFTSGTTSIFYKEFGLTMAAAVAISLLNAMTLCPALSARILRGSHNLPYREEGNNTHASNVLNRNNNYIHKVITKISNIGKQWSRISSHYRGWAVGGVAIAFILLVYFISTTKSGLVPQEDMGTIDVNVQCPPGYSLNETSKVMNQVEGIIRTIPQIKIYTRMDGRDTHSNKTSSAGSFSIRLKPWTVRTEKDDNVDSVVNVIYKKTACIKEANINCSTLPMIRGYGSASGFEMYVENRNGEDFRSLENVTKEFLKQLNRRPEISKAFTTFNSGYPQYEVTVDAAHCMMNNVSPKDVLSALGAYVGGDYSSNVNKFTKLYRVMIQASPQYRLNEEALMSMFVRASDGTMSPLSEYVTLKKVNGAEYLTHFNMFPSIQINGTPSAGHSSSEAIAAIEEVASQTLPAGYSYEFGGMAREESSTGNKTTLILILSFVFIYIILSSLYESLLIPFSVLLVIPFGLCGSFLFSRIAGVENNIYMQTGLIMLIGMLAKTAILLVQYAVEARRRLSIEESAKEALKIRLRPIIMTATVMVFGMLPLVFSSGAGSRGDLSIGIGVLGGMIVGTIAIIMFVPKLFCIFERLDERIK